MCTFVIYDEAKRKQKERTWSSCSYPVGLAHGLARRASCARALELASLILRNNLMHMAAHSIRTCTINSIRRAGPAPAATSPRRNAAAVYTVVVITDFLERSWTDHAWWSEADLSLVPVVVYEGCGEICVFLSWGVHLPPNKHVPVYKTKYGQGRQTTAVCFVVTRV